MSEKFGLDWKKYDAQRVMILYTVYNEIQDEEVRQRKKQEAKMKKR